MTALRGVDLNFLETAPKVLRFIGEIAAPRSAVFAAVSDPAGWVSWFPSFTRGGYRGDGPHGVGSIREVRLRGGAQFRETILAWEEGTRYTWRVDESSQPVARALVEDWSLRSDSPAGPTTVTWTFAVDPTTWFRVALPLARLVMGAIFRRAIRALDAQLR